MKDRTGTELIDVRRRLREELRSLIDRIDLYPLGRVPMTPERVNEIMDAFQDVLPEMVEKELQQAEADLKARINNKELRQFNILFKSGSFRTLEPANPQKLSIDFDRENDRAVFQNHDGTTRVIEK